jgi:MFS family permease
MRWMSAGLWRNPEFMKLWVGHTVSRFGSRITDDALPATAVFVLAATPAQLGWLVALESAPLLLVGLFAGVWVDRLHRRPIMIAADLGRALLLGSIPAAAALHMLHVEQLYIVAALAGALTVFFDVADQSFLPVLVRRENIAEGNSKLGMSGSIAEAAGPALGGSMIQLFSAPATILIDAVSFLISALSIGLIRTHEPTPVPHEERQSGWRDAKEGLRLVFSEPILRAMAGHAATSTFFGSFFAALYWPYAVRELGLGAALVGILISVGGVSALVGAILTGPITRRFGLGSAMVWSAVFAGLASLLIPLAGGALITAAAFLFAQQSLGDIFWEVYEINEISLRQGIVPDRLLGRANASMHFIAGGLLPIGALAAGALADHIGMKATLFIGGFGLLVASLWVIFSPIRELRKQPSLVEA